MMCDFCMLIPNCEIGKKYEVKPCALGDLGVRAQYSVGGIILFRDQNLASGYFDINFCPICGRKIEKEEKENVRQFNNRI